MAAVYNSQLDAFELYHQIREDGAVHSSSKSPSSHLLRALGDGLSGSAGAAISNIATYPLDLIITRLQIQRQLRADPSKASADEYESLVDAARKIYDNEGGWKGLYTGLVSDTGKTIADSFCFFLMYDYLRKGRLAKNGGGRKSLPALEEMTVGFVAGATTKLLTTPIANVVTRKQAAALRDASPSTSSSTSSADKNPSIKKISQTILSEKGITGFWSGYSASLILTLNPSLTFFLFELLKRLTLPRSKRDNPPASLTFLLAATSKAIASSVTYPFSVAKARVQSGSTTTSSSSSSSTPAERTIISTLLTILSTEGPSSLYNGVHLEILKSFFSHGITMLVKQSLSRLLTRAYYIVSIIMSNYHASAARKQANRLVQAAKSKDVGYYDLSIKRVSERVEQAREAARGKADEALEFMREYVDENGDEDGLVARVMEKISGVKS